MTFYQFTLIGNICKLFFPLYIEDSFSLCPSDGVMSVTVETIREKCSVPSRQTDKYMQHWFRALSSFLLGAFYRYRSQAPFA